MVEIEITKLSSKGQIVIPTGLRRGFSEGDKMLIIRDGDRIIIKKATDIDKTLKEDLEFATRTEEAYKRIEAGEYISVDSDNLFDEMKKW